MGDLFETVALYFITPPCYEQYFVTFNFFDGECMRSTLSKVVGLLIVAASVVVKVPQILKMIKNKSGQGVSLLGVSLELSSMTSCFLYCFIKGFPFSAWGDGLFMAIQTATILCLILYYKKQTKELCLFLSIYLSLIFLVVAGIIPLSFLLFLQILNLPIVISGKGAQVLANYKNQSTGQLSAITYWLLFGGTLSRVLTSVQETGDNTIILTFALAAAFNGIILFQVYYYAKTSEKHSKMKEKGKFKSQKSD